MPNFAGISRFNKIPALGFVPESSPTAPTAPVVGLLWIDTSLTPKLLKVWDGAGWAISNLYFGTTAGSVTQGNDSRLSDQRVPTDGSVTGGAAGAGVKIAASTVTAANLALALTDGTAATKQIRSLGTAATDATAGNDARLSDTRTPTAASVVDASVAAGAAIAESKLALASDAVAATASRRTLGTGAQQAAAGNDARLSDTRTPSTGSVVDASVAAGAAIAESKLALASDAAAGTASRRTLGTTATSAMAGNRSLDSITAPTAAVNLAGFKITNLGAPTLSSDAARLADVQAASAGIDVKPSVRASTTGNVVIASGLVTGTVIDGVTLTTGDRVLVKNQTTATENGSYVVPAAGAASRTDDVITANAFWFVEEGTANADTSWMVTNNGVITIGTTALTLAQFGAPGSSSGTANRITVTGGVIDIAANYVGQSSITTVGTITSGVWTGTSIAVANGGTGATTPAAARSNLGASQAGFRGLIASALVAGTPLLITHNLNTDNCLAQVRDATTGEYVFLDVVDAPATPNTLTVKADIAFAANALDIVIIPI